MNRRETRAAWRDRFRGAAPVQAARPAQRPALQVQIQSLRLHGFDAPAGRRIADAFSRELTARLQASGVPSGWMDSAGIAPGRVLRLRRGMSPGAIGVDLAEVLMEAE
jgi:hypothetical protein